MKKVLIILILSTLCFIGVHAQISLSAGPKGGVNIADLKQDIDDNMLVTFNAGAFAELSLGEYIALQPEVVFSRQGAELEALKNIVEQHFDYITIPLILKIKLSDLSVEVGGQFGFLTSATSGKLNIKKITKLQDKGINLGLGYRFHNFYLQARYYFGLDNINKTNIANLKNQVGDLKHRVIQISLGYYLL